MLELAAAVEHQSPGLRIPYAERTRTHAVELVVVAVVVDIAMLIADPETTQVVLFLQDRCMREHHRVEDRTIGAHRSALVDGRILALVALVGRNQIRHPTLLKRRDGIGNVERLDGPLGQKHRQTAVGSVEAIARRAHVFGAHREQIRAGLARHIEHRNGVVFLKRHPSRCSIGADRDVFWLEVLRQRADVRSLADSGSHQSRFVRIERGKVDRRNLRLGDVGHHLDKAHRTLGVYAPVVVRLAFVGGHNKAAIGAVGDHVGQRTHRNLALEHPVFVKKDHRTGHLLVRIRAGHGHATTAHGHARNTSVGRHIHGADGYRSRGIRKINDIEAILDCAGGIQFLRTGVVGRNLGRAARGRRIETTDVLERQITRSGRSHAVVVDNKHCVVGRTLKRITAHIAHLEKEVLVVFNRVIVGDGDVDGNNIAVARNGDGLGRETMVRAVGAALGNHFEVKAARGGIVQIEDQLRHANPFVDRLEAIRVGHRAREGKVEGVGREHGRSAAAQNAANGHTVARTLRKAGRIGQHDGIVGRTIVGHHRRLNSGNTGIVGGVLGRHRIEVAVEDQANLGRIEYRSAADGHRAGEAIARPGLGRRIRTHAHPIGGI